MHWPLIGSLISSENDTTRGRRDGLLSFIISFEAPPRSDDHQINFVQSTLLHVNVEMNRLSMSEVALFYALGRKIGCVPLNILKSFFSSSYVFLALKK